jgi:hypothetical protein
MPNDVQQNQNGTASDALHASDITQPTTGRTFIIPSLPLLKRLVSAALIQK